ncbi:22726_t:CDS:2 [Cetraspora pellucida]|uniref:22726_t:CDS:1 n=1 Tax=Cetraspora pellucida TaxID=1433469 RepID=A0A9N9AD73_9GLOM|nr:22726_t:CDS:2 [Cetraspora pellucida]
MVKTNYYNGLNPAVSQALINLQYRYSNEMPKIFIYLTERSRNREFTVEKHSFYIYCTVYDTLVFIRENTIECANHHLNECIAKIAKRHFVHSNPFQKKGERSVLSLSSDEVNEIFMNYSIYSQCGYHVYNIENEFREKIAYSLFNSAKIIQQAWRDYKNDDIPDDKKFLDVILRKIKNSYTHQQHNLCNAKIIAMINEGYNYLLSEEYKEYYLPDNWIERKKK